jgi:hypothetical protein
MLLRFDKHLFAYNFKLDNKNKIGMYNFYNNIFHKDNRILRVDKVTLMLLAYLNHR